MKKVEKRKNEIKQDSLASAELTKKIELRKQK
jgi:hypothetical protein